MNPPGYRSMLRGKAEGSRFELRLELVRYAEAYGIREAARAFRASRGTVRLWLGRYRAEGARGLVERSRAPRRIPHKTSWVEERRVVEARLRVPCFGPRRLREAFGLRAGKGAIGRILRERGLVRERRTKRRKRADLRAAKAAYRALTRWEMDSKVLTDIAAYYAQMEELGLPRYQYTSRDVRCGAVFLGFAWELSATYASLFARRTLGQLGRFGIELGEVVIQTDRGSEYGGGERRRRARGFRYTVEELCGARHVFTPPRWPNANADVEAFHRLVEEEFFELERFLSLEDFLRKATLYQHYFNFARPNSYKGGLTPWQILSADHPGIRPEVLLLPPVLLEAEFQRRGVGQDVPGRVAAARGLA